MKIKTFAKAITPEAVTHSDQPFKLKAGGESHWYVDHRVAFGRIHILKAAAGLIIGKAKQLGVEYELVASSGIGGNALAVVTAWTRGGKTEWVVANPDKSDTSLEDGYGLHGGRVAGRQVLLVDDIGTTGLSLLEVAGMVGEAGGHVDTAITVTDRSNGRAKEAMAAIGVAYHSLLMFDEFAGRLVPTP